MSMREISAADLVQVIDRGGVVVDVREFDEYLEGHVPGAISVPLSRVPENIETFRRPVPVYVVCQSGGRSSRACELLLDADVTNVVNVAGGTMGYAAMGNPLNVGETP